MPGPQVWRWRGQYQAGLLDGETPLPAMLQLGEWLAAHIPLNDSDPAITRISHGDFRQACLPISLILSHAFTTFCHSKHFIAASLT